MKIQILAFIFISSLSSCKKSLSTVNHSAGDIVAEDSSLNWYGVERKDFVGQLLETTSSDEAHTTEVPESHHLVKHLQNRLTALDNFARSNYPQKFNKVRIPVPNLVVLDIHNLRNAFVSPQNVCIPVKTKILNTNIVQQGLEEFPGYAIEPGVTGITDADYTRCKMVSPSQANQYSKFLLNKNSPCKMSFAKGVLNLGNCDYYGYFKQSVRNFLSFSTTSPFIVFSKNLLENITREEHFIAILAHELAHYYKAHPTIGHDFKIFYEVPREGSVHRPSPSPKLTALGNAIEKRVAPNEIEEKARHPYSTTFNGRLRLNLQNLIWDAQKCSSDCSIAFKISDRFSEDQSEVPLSDSELKEWRQALYSCTSKYTVTELGNSNSCTINLERLNTAFDGVKPPFKSASGRLSDVIRSQYNEIDKYNAETKKMYANAAAQRMGIYTVEQEADEVAIELLSGIGVKPLEFIDFLLMGTLGDFPSQEVAECNTQYKNGWNDSTGKPSFFPITDIGDLHNSGCLRVYNYYKEWRAHNFPVKKGATWLSPAEWKKLVSTMN